MSFASKAWSSETLLRGLDLVDQASKLPMASLADPDEQAMQQELTRLEATEKYVDLLCRLIFARISIQTRQFLKFHSNGSWWATNSIYNFSLQVARHLRRSWICKNKRLKDCHLCRCQQLCFVALCPKAKYFLE